MSEEIKQKEEQVQESEEKERKVVVPGEVVGSQEDLPGDGTTKIDNKVISQKYGLLEKSGKVVKVIPLSGVFIPRRGNVIIGKVDDISFNGWMTDVNSAYSSFLPVSEIPRYLDKNHLSDFLNIGDFFSAKINSVKQKGIDLTMDSRGLGKLEGGIIISINPNKVPRVIGRAGSMISLIKDETNSKITVGQNGLVWIRAEKIEDELLAKRAIEFVTEKSFVSGLTEKVKEFLDQQKSNSGKTFVAKESKDSSGKEKSGEKK
jgi:exosome complex component RRP4